MSILVGLIVSIAFFIICYLSTNKFIYAIAVFIITFLYFAIYVHKKMKEKEKKISRFHDCYQFINNFLISLSIKGSLSGALASALESQKDEVKDLIDSLDTKDPMEKVKYLRNYFSFDIYSLFIDLINLFNEEGGDIIAMSHYLLNQIRADEEYIVNSERLNTNSLIEFSILWCFSLVILIVIKYSLDDFFEYIVGNIFYQISVVAILLFALVTINIAVGKVTSINIKGWENHE